MLYHFLCRHDLPVQVVYNLLETGNQTDTMALYQEHHLKSLQVLMSCFDPVLQVIEALANEGQWKPALTLYNKMLNLRLDPPPMASDAVFRVCRANDAQVDLAFIQPQTLHVKVKHRVKRKVYKKPVSVATSVDYPIAAAFEGVRVVVNPHNAVTV